MKIVYKSRRALILLAVVFTGCITLKFGERFIPGSYFGESAGYYGKIAVSVETDSMSIDEIIVLEHNEDDFIGLEAINELVDAVLEADSTLVDAVSGATVSSEAFLEAVNAALAKAKLKSR